MAEKPGGDADSRSQQEGQLQKLPLYTYVPGLTPHPKPEPHPVRPIGESLRHGKALFDAGFYWEAHEAWEAAWITAGRTGAQADFLKALIKLAACGVKCLEQNERGALRHATRAKELFQGLLIIPHDLPEPDQSVLITLEQFAERLIEQLPTVAESDRQAAQTGGVPRLGTLPWKSTRSPRAGG